MSNDPTTTVIDFLNTLDVDEGTDALDDLESWRVWIGDSFGLDGSAQTPQQLSQARVLRDRLRTLALGAPLSDCSPEIPVRIRLDESAGATVHADDVVGMIAAAVLRLSIDGRWPRIKICPADDCLWAFYDESKNRSRQWCSMRVCGNRAKARHYRERSGRTPR